MPDVDDEDEELLDALLPLGDGDDTLDNEALGIDELFDHGDAESLDLDDASGGLEEASLFALDLPPEEAGRDEERGDALDSDLLTIEGVDTDDEYGWVGDGGDADENWDPQESDLPNLAPLGRDDGGEEGVEETIELGVEGDDAVPHLPTLDAEDDEDDADDLVLAADEIAAMLRPIEGAPEPEIAARPSRPVPPALPTRLSVDAQHLGPRDDDVRCVSLPPRLAGGTGLYAVGPTLSPCGLGDHRVVSIALGTPEQPVLVGTAFDGLFRSLDGERFERLADWPVGGAWVVREHGASRLWARTESGGLYRSSDEGESWVGPLLLKPVVALAAPKRGGVVVLCAGRDAPSQLARSDDGGERWAAVDGPPVPPGLEGAEWSLAVLGDLVAVAADLDAVRVWVSDDRGRSWVASPHPTGGTTALSLVQEAGAPTLYVASGSGAGCTVRRVRPGGEPEQIALDVAAEAIALGIEPRGDGDGEARVHGLEATEAPEATVLWAATGVGLFRVDVHWGAPAVETAPNAGPGDAGPADAGPADADGADAGPADAGPADADGAEDR